VHTFFNCVLLYFHQAEANIWVYMHMNLSSSLFVNSLQHGNTVQRINSLQCSSTKRLVDNLNCQPLQPLELSCLIQCQRTQLSYALWTNSKTPAVLHVADVHEPLSAQAFDHGYSITNISWLTKWERKQLHLQIQWPHNAGCSGCCLLTKILQTGFESLLSMVVCLLKYSS
jgi:hypothetical protein